MKRNSKSELKQISAIQSSMTDAVESCLSARELEALRVVIRLTMEFHRELKANKINNYVAESVFSGIDSFALLLHAYKVLQGAEMHTHLQWKTTSSSELRRKFLSLYSRFVAEKHFERQCRYLLDLFKLEIVLAAMTYDCEDETSLAAKELKKSRQTGGM